METPAQARAVSDIRETALIMHRDAPDFELPSQSGQLFRLNDLIGKKPIVLFFYPRDNSPVCTAESCAFRDSFEDFVDAGAEVIGISSDSVETHAKFSLQHKLPYLLLSDAGGKVRELYKVPTTFGLIPGRVTYIIDAKGKIRHTFTSQFEPHKHVSEALRVLRLIFAP